MKNLGEMNLQEDFQEGIRQAQAKPYWNIVLFIGFTAIALLVAIRLPVAWYWKILAFLACRFALSIARTIVYQMISS